MEASREHIEALLVAEAPCVTIFVRLDHDGFAGDVDRQRAARLLRDAQSALEARGWSSRQASATIDSTRTFVQNSARWPSAWRGLVLYASPSVSEQVGLRHRVDDRFVIADHFLVTPLIRDIAANMPFWVLALSRDHPRLFAGDAATLRDANVDLPTFDEVVAFSDADGSLQQHSVGRGPAHAVVAFHGHGGTKDLHEAHVVRWLRALAAHVDQTLNNGGQPLVLAGVAEQAAQFRSVSGYTPIVDTVVAGNPDHRTPAELHRAAHPMLDAQHRQVLDRDIERYRAMDGTGWTVTGAEPALRAATEGRIEVVFALAAPPANIAADVDAVARAVWLRGGAVHVSEAPIPTGEAVAAILRYPAPGGRPGGEPSGWPER